RRAGLEAEPVEREAQRGAGVDDALTDPTPRHLARDAADDRDARLRDMGRGLPSVGRGDQLVILLEPDDPGPRVYEGAGTLHDEVEEHVEVGLGADRARHRGDGLKPTVRAFELVAPGRCLAVEPRGLDPDRR